MPRCRFDVIGTDGQKRLVVGELVSTGGTYGVTAAGGGDGYKVVRIADGQILVNGLDINVARAVARDLYSVVISAGETPREAMLRVLRKYLGDFAV